MSNLNLNKKRLLTIVATSAVIVGTTGAGIYGLLNKNNETIIERNMHAASKEFLKDNDVAISDGNSIKLSANFLAESGYLDTKNFSSDCMSSNIIITNNNNEYEYTTEAICNQEDRITYASEPAYEDADGEETSSETSYVHDFGSPTTLWKIERKKE